MTEKTKFREHIAQSGGVCPQHSLAFPMSEVNYRRNGQKYSSSGHCWGLSPKFGKVKAEDPTAPKPKSSRERRAMKKGK